MPGDRDFSTNSSGRESKNTHLCMCVCVCASRCATNDLQMWDWRQEVICLFPRVKRPSKLDRMEDGCHFPP